MPELAVSTPGVDRIVVVQVGAHQFGCRRPSRGDNAEIWRRFATKLVVTGIETESNVLNLYDGNPLLWEARLEVCLVPRLIAGAAVSLGERAPLHWLEQVENRPARISFDNVDPDEFDAVCARLEDVFKKKPLPPMPPAHTAPIGSSAPDSKAA